MTTDSLEHLFEKGILERVFQMCSGNSIEMLTELNEMNNSLERVSDML